MKRHLLPQSHYCLDPMALKVESIPCKNADRTHDYNPRIILQSHRAMEDIVIRVTTETIETQ
jgi:hypothetical protein